MRSSCCGHGKGLGEICLQDGRVLKVDQKEDKMTILTLTKTERKTLDEIAEQTWFRLLLDAFSGQRSVMTEGEWDVKVREIELEFCEWINK